MSIRLFVVAVCITAFACFTAGLSSAGTVGAKGNDLAIYPGSGGIDTLISVSSEIFAPDAEVTFEVAFVGRIDEAPGSYSAPIAVQHANGSGRNEVQVYLRDAPGIVIPNAPGFVLFRATSGAPNARIAEGMFVFTVDGRRPRGSGEARLSVNAKDGVTPTTAIYAWRRAGSGEDFYSPYAGYLSLPLSTTIPWLDDGDWEILVLGGLDTVALGEGEIDTVEASFCGSNPSPCGVPPRPLRVKRVTIRNAQPVDVSIVLGDPQSLPTTGSGSSIGKEAERELLAVRVSLLGLALVLAGLWVRRVPRRRA